jgi:sugar porter (SP) family MFS transporter
MQQKIQTISITVAMAGFLFGFDTVVISGADQALQKLWNSSDLFHGSVVMSMALWGTVIGAMFAGWPSDRYGRRITLIGIGWLYLISAVGSALATDPFIFSFFRFVGGLGVGASTVAAPTYISEIAPAAKRGQLVALYQFNIVAGIMMAYISNFLLMDVGDQPWRWMIGAEAIPAVLYTILIYFVPASPRWVIAKFGDIERAQTIMERIRGARMSDQELSGILDEIAAENTRAQQKGAVKASIYNKMHRYPLMLAFLIALFNQLSGINAFLYYAPRIFETAGLATSSALLSSIGIGIVNVIFTLLGMYLIDRRGRKDLMFIGSIGYILSLTMVGLSFLLEWKGIFIPLFFFIFISAHAIGQGAVIWVYIAEIFPTQVRAQGQAFGSSTHWVLAALITLFMPWALSSFANPGYVFLFFASMMVFQLLFVLFMMVETKGKSLEEVSRRWTHPA